ncbi:cryptochrome/photolyase family protein [Flavobacterium lindanitolerans]|uniref:Deoxyribodipyrimidine photo-lyase n=1 Tax=Flavobacterium lindanitolerans TaxID=428988 RepID=A0A497UIQ2_9FLAO|nr:deoxyribodipyrimidine photo-lyase [Flavobacterium lindanitolerans]PKW20929.1 deoxyribodipyrimidine photo-lyase [Flavobacterium lindanitolerans]RLJ30432.1 deoxyribodipyrimidine photo-lyase [Flavobacterium lindanitolerans]
MNIFWFRRDLRLDDNKALFEALSNNATLPVFIFDKNILSELPKDDARVTFISALLDNIQAILKQNHKSLAVFHDGPIHVFKKLVAENAEINAVYTNHDYEPYAQKRDAEVGAFLKSKNIAFHTFKDQVIFEKEEVIKEDGKPYVVFTPYSKKWKENFNEKLTESFPSEKKLAEIAQHSYPYLSLKEIGFEASGIKVADYNISSALIENYAETRNFPGIEGTSHLSPHLRFGAVSIRKIVKTALKHRKETFLNELIWREFFMQILWHFPNTVTESFRPKYDHIQWRNNKTEFQSWCEGTTGYPIVDAGMRQLNATGTMHNRVRMIVASFLCKHLLIDWRWGEAYFAEKLLDYEQSSNIGNWQWAAGSGVDAAPYFRIFNPSEQVRKFDKNLKYIRKWVPEFEQLDYRPIIDHKEARERCLVVYKKAVG